MFRQQIGQVLGDRCIGVGWIRLGGDSTEGPCRPGFLHGGELFRLQGAHQIGLHARASADEFISGVDAPNGKRACEVIDQVAHGPLRNGQGPFCRVPQGGLCLLRGNAKDPALVSQLAIFPFGPVATAPA